MGGLYPHVMPFLRWMNNPITYIYLVIAIILFIGTVNMKPSQFDRRPNPTSPDPAPLIFLLFVGLFLVRGAWSVVKIVAGSFNSAMTGKPEKHAGKPFSFWDY